MLVTHWQGALVAAVHSFAARLADASLRNLGVVVDLLAAYEASPLNDRATPVVPGPMKRVQHRATLGHILTSWRITSSGFCVMCSRIPRGCDS